MTTPVTDLRAHLNAKRQRESDATKKALAKRMRALRGEISAHAHRRWSEDEVLKAIEEMYLETDCWFHEDVYTEEEVDAEIEKM